MCRADNLYHIHVSIVLKSGSLSLLEPSRAVQACNGIALPFTLHVLDGLSVHHQEFKIVHTATGVCQTDTVVCLLASRQQYLFDMYLLLYVQS